MFCAITNLCSGDWKAIDFIDEKLFNDATKKGYLWNISTYLWAFCVAKAEQGDFSTAKILIEKLYEHADTYGYNLSFVNANLNQAELIQFWSHPGLFRSYSLSQ